MAQEEIKIYVGDKWSWKDYDYKVLEIYAGEVSYSFIDVNNNYNLEQDTIEAFLDGAELIERNGVPVESNEDALNRMLREKYSKYDIHLLKFDEDKNELLRMCYTGGSVDNFSLVHTCAQSLKGFASYVYILENDLSHHQHPIRITDDGRARQPIAVLFYKD